jgi:hypothetical protein
MEETRARQRAGDRIIKEIKIQDTFRLWQIKEKEKPPFIILMVLMGLLVLLLAL